MKNLFHVSAINRNTQDVVAYDNVYDLNHLWDVKHDSLRLMIWTGENSLARREFIDMVENDILIYIMQESV